jgi:hypothetical protein
MTRTCMRLAGYRRKSKSFYQYMGDNALLVVMPEKPERQLRVGSVEQEPGSIQSRKKQYT